MDSDSKSVQSEMAVSSCPGRQDGKHVAIWYPKKGGSLYYNHKGFHPIVLLGLVDVDYKFIWADMGSNCAVSDTQIFTDSELKEARENNVIGFPNYDRNTLYFIVGDDAFCLKAWMMKPYGRLASCRENLQLPVLQSHADSE